LATLQEWSARRAAVVEPPHIGRRGPWPRRRRGRSATGILVLAVASTVLGLLAPAASAAPSDTATAQTARDAAAAEVDRIEQLVAEAEEKLARFTVEAEAAADASRQAQEELAAAQAQASAAAAELEAANSAVDQARGEVADLGRESYMNGVDFGAAEAFLGSSGPGDFVQRAVTLDFIGDDRSERLAAFRVVREAQARAEEAARAAMAERDRAAGGAAEAEAEANAQLAEAQAAYDGVVAEKAEYDRQLQQAEIELLAAEGAEDARAAWEAGVNAERAQADAAVAANAAAAASGSAVAPTTGRVTSCYGPRWGTMHNGVDIAAPIGTPVYTPQAGRVLQAGPASGFGLAVYVQHEDGSVTVYGHINAYFVAAGQQVSAGQQIAEVGNRGQSTGPHLHFEVHAGGLYQNRVNPVPWLSARGVSLGGSC
jgi:murein DD-endopeptidase MepM/ murein hydrolase activator NlpD